MTREKSDKVAKKYAEVMKSQKTRKGKGGKDIIDNNIDEV